jgi:hypothetical protein
MIKRIALAVLAGAALSPAFAAVASADPAPNTGGISGLPSGIYPDGVNTITHLNPAADTLPL